jgi:hypothetical protein
LRVCSLLSYSSEQTPKYRGVSSNNGCGPRAAGNTENGYSAKRDIPVVPDRGIAARQFPACEAQKMRYNDWKKRNDAALYGHAFKINADVLFALVFLTSLSSSFALS